MERGGKSLYSSPFKGEVRRSGLMSKEEDLENDV
jgi:hypothetical protein